MPEVPSREVRLRTAVSRAYYTAYYEALARARREGYVGTPPGFGSHEGLWEWWFVSQRPDLEIADAGRTLKSERVRADYRRRESPTFVRAQAIVADAKLAFDLVRAL